MLRLSGLRKARTSNLHKSKLFNEDTFYLTFEDDLHKCQSELIIESPFMTTRRIKALLPRLQTLINREVRITVNTKDPEEHDIVMRVLAKDGIEMLQALGVQVLFTGGHHRKIAIIDRRILWEGSLNILSQHDSCEIMRRIDSKTMAKQMIAFINLHKFI